MRLWQLRIAGLPTPCSPPRRGSRRLLHSGADQRQAVRDGRYYTAGQNNDEAGSRRVSGIDIFAGHGGVAVV